MAIVKSEFVWRQIGWGCVNAASICANSDVRSLSKLQQKIPRGAIRMRAPFAWLSRFRWPRNPADTVDPQSNGDEFSHIKYAFCASPASYRLNFISIRAKAKAISESSVGWPAIVPHV